MTLQEILGKELEEIEKMQSILADVRKYNSPTLDVLNAPSWPEAVVVLERLRKQDPS
jgi:hypothetical protein